MRKRWSLSMLLFLLVFLPLFLGMAQADEYDDLQRQKDQTLEEINRKKSAERETKQKQGGVQSSIAGTRTKIGDVDSQLTSKKKEIKELTEIRKLQSEDLDQKLKDRNSLIRLIYKKSKVPPLYLFLSQDSFTNLIRSLGKR